MTELVLIRHGQTVWGVDDRYAGASDIALTPLGNQQAERMAKWARWAKLTALWCSPLQRARDTAAHVEKHTGLKRHIDPRLRELDFGRGEGKTIEEMQQMFPDALAAWQKDPVANPMPGGENPQEAIDRMIACFADIDRKHADSRVMVVGHGTVFRLAMCQLMQIPPHTYRHVFPTLHNTTITEIQFDGDKCALLQYNSPIPKIDE